jgi:hypothetical protein
VLNCRDRLVCEEELAEHFPSQITDTGNDANFKGEKQTSDDERRRFESDSGEQK